jgi:hypothetical protein
MTEDAKPIEEPHDRRPGDHGFWCVVARRATDVWDFLENRDIFEHLLTVWTLYMVERYTVWCMHFAEAHPDMDGLKMAAILGAVGLALMAFATPVAKFWFNRE